jgi:hypothetical protein
MKINSKQFQTYDLGLAAALITVGFDLQGLTKANPKRVSFNFIDSDRVYNFSNAYWSGKVKVNPRLYFDNIKLLKNRIYSSI